MKTVKSFSAIPLKAKGAEDQELPDLYCDYIFMHNSFSFKKHFRAINYSEMAAKSPSNHFLE